jgi:hypothetical protein
MISFMYETLSLGLVQNRYFMINEWDSTNDRLTDFRSQMH